jgi:ABC-type ATPase involved in cell division
VIWLEGVCCLRDGSLALDTVTLGVASGECVVVEGSAASGKSTLLEIAAVERVPDRGAVWFAGRNVVSLQEASLPFVRRNIGFCAAEPLLLPNRTVLDNVALALAVRGEDKPAARELAMQALDALEAAALAPRKVRSLSSGQTRLVALARALAGPPPVVVADEPGVHVGEQGHAVVVAALMRARAAGAAVLCGTSDASLAESLVAAGGRRVHLAEGHIVGAPAVGLVPDFDATEAAPASGESRIITLEIDDEGERMVPPATRGPT